MDQFESPPSKKTGMIVVILVILGVGAVGIGGFLVWNKKNGNGAGTIEASREMEPWCKLRQEWAKNVEPLKGDIMIAFAKKDEKARAAHVLKRNTLCQDFATKVRDLKVTDPVLQAIEVALVKEGKTRANIDVMIHNVLTKVNAPDTPTLTKQKARLVREIKQKMDVTKAETDKVIKEAMSTVSDGCTTFYRGTMTDEGTSSNPYTSWEELELKRKQAVSMFDAAIKELEPKEQFVNRIYHALMAHHRGNLSKCYKKAKAIKPTMSSKLGFRVRLDRMGKVKGLAVEWMENRGEGGDEKFLDCIEKVAAKWKLPIPDLKPGQKTDIYIVSLDFSVI
jgi:hypothetical protein